MDSTKNTIIKDILVGLLVTIIGGIIVAMIIQEGDRFKAQPPSDPTIVSNESNIPFPFPTSTITVIPSADSYSSENQLVLPIETQNADLDQTKSLNLTETPNHPYIYIKNILVEKVRVDIDGIYKGEVEGNSEKIFILDSYPSRVSWQTTKAYSNEEEIFGSTFENVYDRDVIVIDNNINGNLYFIPILDNNTSGNCKVTVNDGLVGAKNPGFLLTNAKNVWVGYYQLYVNSNVYMYCENMTFYYGLEPGNTDSAKSIMMVIEKGTGILRGSASFPDETKQ